MEVFRIEFQENLRKINGIHDLVHSGRCYESIWPKVGVALEPPGEVSPTDF
jgi:hypothetical protein